MNQTETRDTIASLHARAEASYRSGDLEDARAAWNEILSLEPGDERAKEGLRLLSLVDPKWEVFEQAGRDAADPGAGLEEIRVLGRAGRFDEALEALETVRAGRPGDEQVEALYREIRAARDLRQEVEARLGAARQALASGDAAGAAEACRGILSIAPGDRETERLLEEAEAVLAGAGPAAGAESDDAGLPLDLELDLDAVASPPAEPAPAPAVAVDPAPAPDGQFELDTPGELPAIPLAEPAPGPAAAAVEPPASPLHPAAPPPEPADEVLDDLFEAAKELEQELPAEELVAPGAELPEAPPAAEPGEADGLVVRAREELERGNTAEATQLAARALALDATHAGAEEILEEARRRDEARARQAEDLLGQAVQALDGGQPQLAIPLLHQVLELIPGHAEARDLLARARAAESVLPQALQKLPPEEVAAVRVATPAPPETVDVPPVEERPPVNEIGREGTPSPGPAEAGTGRAEGASAPARADGRKRAAASPRKGLLAAVVALVLVAGGGVAAWQFGLLPFGRGEEGAEETPAPVRRRPQRKSAQARERAGQAPGAADAGGEAAGAGAAVATAGQAPARITKRDVPRLVRQADQALRRGDEAKAVELLEAARQADPLDFDLVEKLESARLRLKERRDAEARLAVAKQAFQDGDWPEALRIFYRIPGPYRPAGIDRWIADGWYNLGVQALQAGDVVEARRYFGDCLELAPDDETARRHREVALRYRGRPLDDAYWMYVRALEPRPLRE